MAEKTEQPTSKKLREARRKGEAPRSRDLGAAVVLLAVTGALVATGSSIVDALSTIFAMVLAVASEQVVAPAPVVLGSAAAVGLRAIAPVLVVAVGAGTLASLLQVGPLLSAEPATPKLQRIDPIQGFGRLFSQRRLVELAKMLLGLAIVGVVAWFTIRDGLRGLVGLTGADAETTLEGAGVLGQTLLLRVGAATLAIGILDLFYQRWRHQQDQKMTKDEVRREHRESEGDPHAKQHRTRMHREIVEHGVLEEVRRADVLIVNPTHFAVALHYDRDDEEAVPEVLAKGQEDLARRMIRAAEEAGVPVMRDVPLARALFELEVGEHIPEVLFEAVAALLHAAWSEREAGANDGRAGDLGPEESEGP